MQDQKQHLDEDDRYPDIMEYNPPSLVVEAGAVWRDEC